MPSGTCWWPSLTFCSLGLLAQQQLGLLLLLLGLSLPHSLLLHAATRLLQEGRPGCPLPGQPGAFGLGLLGLAPLPVGPGEGESSARGQDRGGRSPRPGLLQNRAPGSQEGGGGQRAVVSRVPMAAGDGTRAAGLREPRAGREQGVWRGWKRSHGRRLPRRQGDRSALTPAPAFWSALSSFLDLVSSPPQSFSSVCFPSD